MRLPFGGRARARLALLPFVSLAIGCANPEDAKLACTQALAHFDELRVLSLEGDPALAGHRELAAEHVRQTSAALTAPLRARCTDDPAAARCVLGAATYQQATECL